MIPSKRQFQFLFLAALVALALLASRLFIVQPSTLAASSSALSESLSFFWQAIVIGFLLAITIDAVRDRKIKDFIVERDIPHSLALGAKTNIALRIENPYQFNIGLLITDSYPRQIVVSELPIETRLLANSSKTLNYSIIPKERGEATFGKLCMRITSRWGFWQRQLWLGEEAVAKIYPNFSTVSYLAKLGLEQQAAYLGIHLQQRRGSGSDFHQLREFREGDALRQIDWKATARYRKPISKDYQDERDQTIVFMLDCGRQLRNQDGELSHFDHALNALLLTGHVALRQGDAVGLLSFAGDERWLSPKKGPATINQISNQIYDLQSTLSTSDYLKAAEDLLARHRKRSLIIIITNIQHDTGDDLISAIKLLQKNHLVLVASLRNEFLEEIVTTPVDHFSAALNFCETSAYFQERSRLNNQLRSSGVFLTDELPQRLHIGLVNEYLKLKRSGRI